MKTVQNNKHRRIEGIIPNWMPHELVQKCGGHVNLKFQFSEGERLVLHKRKPEKPSIWTEKHRVLRLSSIPGKWKHIFTPYLAGIMDAR